MNYYVFDHGQIITPLYLNGQDGQQLDNPLFRVSRSLLLDKIPKNSKQLRLTNSYEVLDDLPVSAIFDFSKYYVMELDFFKDHVMELDFFKDHVMELDFFKNHTMELDFFKNHTMELDFSKYHFMELEIFHIGMSSFTMSSIIHFTSRFVHLEVLTNC